MAEPRRGSTSPSRPAVRFDLDDPVLAAAAWSRVAEPGDVVAGALVEHLGAAGALRWLVDAATDPAGAWRAARIDRLPLPESPTVPGGPSPGVRDGADAVSRLAAAVRRWAPRLDSLDPRRELRVLERCGGALVTRDDPHWPAAFADLGPTAPFALWVRGRADVAAWAERSVALVGSRASTRYGERVTEELAAGLADRGFTVVSGGAYGIDASAHRGALAAAGTTCAVLAGGVDRYYPQGNDGLLRRTVDDGGAVLSEVPPGSAPFRQRFLARNRLIAALTRATVVVEAARRSGALSTARRAADLLRPLGAVPGPVTSMASAGCHGLLRDGAAVCVTSAAEVAELAGRIGHDAEPDGPADGDDLLGELGPDERMLRDALPLRSGATVDGLARSAGLSPRRVLTLLGGFERRGLARCDAGRWSWVR
ncbi:DNA-processing protein DprA [Isoptericola sediminis]|uniref:DNA-protecting protein DprA n=1 Tax=Isoptericola sediminis TaxID=2733572 RepID=A0A849K374_9MICO|nr:DNA-protecting protein DprA [Isoptericola sediminis]